MKPNPHPLTDLQQAQALANIALARKALRKATDAVYYGWDAEEYLKAAETLIRKVRRGK